MSTPVGCGSTYYLTDEVGGSLNEKFLAEQSEFSLAMEVARNYCHRVGLEGQALTNACIRIATATMQGSKESLERGNTDAYSRAFISRQALLQSIDFFAAPTGSASETQGLLPVSTIRMAIPPRNQRHMVKAPAPRLAAGLRPSFWLSVVCRSLYGLFAQSSVVAENER